jgi:hypothetical protein
MSFKIRQCRRNFIADMEKYFEQGRDLTDEGFFLSLEKNLFSRRITTDTIISMRFL